MQAPKSALKTGRNQAGNWRRRDVLKLGAAGLAGLSLGGPSSSRAAAGAPTRSARNLILILCVGGPSQLETWDPKPDAPAEVRGPYGAMETSVSGIRISETLPRLARLAHEYAIIRSVHHDAPAVHELGRQAMQTGSAVIDGPTLPSIVDVLSGRASPSRGDSSSIILPGPLPDAGSGPGGGEGAGNPTRAPRVRTALDLSREATRILDRYGRHPFGESCLAARRLLERDARAVVINQFTCLLAGPTWDCHAHPFLPTRITDLKDEVAAPFDQAVSALIEDLRQRGLYEETLVCCFGEFGRTPKITDGGGRDHWTRCWSVMIGGGGIGGGQVIGASDAHAAEPIERPVTPAMVIATLYSALGIDPDEIGMPAGTEPLTELLPSPFPTMVRRNVEL